MKAAPKSGTAMKKASGKAASAKGKVVAMRKKKSAVAPMKLVKRDVRKQVPARSSRGKKKDSHQRNAPKKNSSSSKKKGTDVSSQARIGAQMLVPKQE